MWLTKFIARRRLKHLLKLHEQLSPLQPNRKACEELIAELNPSFFADYHPDKGHKSAPFFYPTIEQYTLKLMEINRTIREKRPISPDWNEGINTKYVSVDHFFTTADGFYVYPAMAIAKFKHQAMELCRSMRASDTETHGIQEHNLRMLTKLFINLRVITQCLVEVSLTKA